MATKTAPPPRKSTKGAPPTTLKVVENLEKPETGKLKPLNFKVAPDFHKEFKGYAVANGMTMQALLEKAFSHYRETK